MTDEKIEALKFNRKAGEKRIQTCLQTMEDAIARRDLASTPKRPLDWEVERVTHILAWRSHHDGQ